MFLGIHEIPFCGHDESETSGNRGNHIELAYFLAEFDKKLENHLKTATVFRGLALSIQNDLIQPISPVVLSEIRKEVKEGMYISILLDETSDISCYSHLSTVLRYVNSSGFF